MRWSEGVAIAAATAAIALLRPKLAEQFHQVSTRSDVYALPSPEQTVVLSLGYRAALADLLLAHVLVSYGLHFQEKRRFEFVGDYLDTITTLDPTFRRPYLFADTLLTLQPVAPRWSDYERARALQQRGLEALPHDGELWTTVGQFWAYLAPSATNDPAVQQEWRLAGARTLARGCELIGGNENLPFHCITAAAIFTRAGEREATVAFLQKVLAISDDEEIRRIAIGHLQRVLGEGEVERVNARFEVFRKRWGADLPFVRKDTLLIIGPAFDPSYCSGAGSTAAEACVTSWRDWGDRQR